MAGKPSVPGSAMPSQQPPILVETPDRSTKVASSSRTPDTVRKSSRPHLHGHLHSDRLKESFSPSTHGLVGNTEKFSDATDRFYDDHVQKWRLWRLSLLEWFTTLALCLSVFGCLWYYHNSQALQSVQVNVFNAIITGLSIALGLNFNASLKSYARMMRWKMLNAQYQTLEHFDLIMGCDRMGNVIELFFKSYGSPIAYLPSLTGLICVLWIMINLAATILVASLGLTYSLGPSPTRVNINNGGLTSVVQLDFISDLANNGTEIMYEASLIAAQQYGIAGLFYSTTPGIDASDAAGFGIINSDPTRHGHYRYWFNDENPSDTNPFLNAAISGRFIDSWSHCDTFDVLQGGFGNLSFIVYSYAGHNVTQPIISLGEQETGAMTVISQNKTTCGPRCTQLKVFQPMYLSNTDGLGIVLNPHFYICNTTMKSVLYNFDSVNYPVLDNVQMPDDVARIIAGVPGWSGAESPNSTEESQTYSRQSPESFNTDSTTEDMEDFLSSFSMSAVAALDYHGPRKNIIGAAPYVANVLSLAGNWRGAGSILAVIPAIHFLVMIAVLIWANQAIILDGSNLAAAKFLKPMMDRLETKGNLMSGEDIVRQLKNPSVKYGWKDVDGKTRHAGIYEESMFTGLVSGPKFESGRYD